MVTAAGDRTFLAGGDFALFQQIIGNLELLAEVMKETSDIVYNMLACEKPIITAINGTAVGNGVAVELLADVGIISENHA